VDSIPDPVLLRNQIAPGIEPEPLDLYPHTQIYIYIPLCCVAIFLADGWQCVFFMPLDALPSCGEFKHTALSKYNGHA
jgi:hypothetical protein